MNTKTKPKESYVTSEEVMRAEENWIYFHRGINSDEVQNRFFTYCHSFEQSFEDDLLSGEGPMHVARDTAQRIIQAAGPHFNAIFEAYYQNHPELRKRR